MMISNQTCSRIECEQLIPSRDFTFTDNSFGSRPRFISGVEHLAIVNHSRSDFTANPMSSVDYHFEPSNLFFDNFTISLERPKVNGLLINDDTIRQDVLDKLMAELLEGLEDDEDLDFFSVLTEGLEILSIISSLETEKYSVEYIEDRSLFFTIIKNDFSVYIGQFFDDEHLDPSSNSNISIFRAGEPLCSFTGKFEDVWSEVLEVIIVD